MIYYDHPMYKGMGSWRWAIYTFHKNTDSNAVSSLTNRNEYNSHYKPRWSLAAI